MSTTRFTLSTTLLAVVASSPLAAQQAQLKQQIDFAKSKVYPALVNISCVTKSFANGRTVRRPSAGSGTIVSPAGHVITNYHVIQGSQRTTCTLPSGETLTAKILAEDPAIDFAVLQLDLSRRRNPNAELPFATLGDSDTVNVGDYVLAVGNPMALSSSMTLGIVSNTRRVFTNFTGTEAEALDIGAQKTGKFTLWIQTDALILPGNSGGALVNLRGEIIGMNTRGGNGLGFATPSTLLKKSLSQIMTYGEVRRGWMGLRVQPVAAEGYQGVLISHVEPNSPAQAAGLRPGDSITEIAGKNVQCRFIDEMPGVYGTIADLQPGSRAEVKFERAGKAEKVHVTVGLHQKFADSQREYRKLGVTLRNVTAPMAAERGYPDADGVLVTGVRTGKAFETAKIQPGDVIIKLGKSPVTTVEDLHATLSEPKPDDSLALTIRRAREVVVCVVDTSKSKKQPRGGELPRPWLGVSTQVMLPEVAEAIGMDSQRGLRITRVFDNTPAKSAGLQVGDVLVGLDDETLECFRTQDARDLSNLLDEYSIGENVTLHVRRGDERLDLELALEASRMVRGDPKKASDDFFEVAVREVTFRDRAARRWLDGAQGVLVAECTNGGWAAMAGLRAGDLIERVDGKQMTMPDEVQAALKAAQATKAEHVRLFVRRGTRTRFVFLEPSYKN